MSEFTSRRPEDGTLIRTWAEASDAEVEATLERAVRAQAALAAKPVAERVRAFASLAKALRANEDALAREITDEVGKRREESLAEVRKSALCCEHYAENAVAGLATVRVDAGARESGYRFDPLGVVLAIMPWNFPLWQVIRCAIPAIAAGNAVVVKHAPNVQGCAERLTALVADAGGLEGALLNLRVSHERVGALISDPRVAAVSLTGSVRAGRAVAALAGAALKPCVLELGGSDPLIVLKDADLDRAVDCALRSRLLNGGQSCIAAKRFVVVDAVYDAFAEALAARWRALVIGRPSGDGVDVGPMARPDLAAALRSQVEVSMAAGAVELARACAPEGPCFVDAVLLGEVVPGMPAFDEETFGPLGALVRARDEADALRLANTTPYGLGASIFTRDEERARSLLSRVRAGHVAINGIVRSDPRLPFGGVGDSGLGRELGAMGLHAFANVRAFTLDGLS